LCYFVLDAQLFLPQPAKDITYGVYRGYAPILRADFHYTWHSAFHNRHINCYQLPTSHLCFSVSESRRSRFVTGVRTAGAAWPVETRPCSIQPHVTFHVPDVLWRVTVLSCYRVTMLPCYQYGTGWMHIMKKLIVRRLLLHTMCDNCVHKKTFGWLAAPYSIPARTKRLSSGTSRMVLGPSQPSVNGYRVVSPEIKSPRCEAGK
jgi:hypothetical protein